VRLNDHIHARKRRDGETDRQQTDALRFSFQRRNMPEIIRPPRSRMFKVWNRIFDDDPITGEFRGESITSYPLQENSLSVIVSETYSKTLLFVVLYTLYSVNDVFLNCLSDCVNQPSSCHITIN